MTTTCDLLLFPETAVDTPSQHGLFDDSDDAAQNASLFGEIVFDRPLDHAYTYAVPDTLVDAIGVGKRVLAPFGKGDRVTTGFCVGISGSGPERRVKEIRRVLDEEVLLTPNLMRLTRWM